jgi:hypothetical protein
LAAQAQQLPRVPEGCQLAPIVSAWIERLIRGSAAHARTHTLTSSPAHKALLTRPVRVRTQHKHVRVRRCAH